MKFNSEFNLLGRLSSSLLLFFVFKYLNQSVTGLPDPCPDHAVVMVKYAHAILNELKTLTIMLERRLGPGTSGLSLRIGVR